ncbi:MAG: hypothetical protein CL846_10045 [Crocinitomicaceae bacterium]|nr:hypothetical protein [Crocinitomicaceae bacterium]
MLIINKFIGIIICVCISTQIISQNIEENKAEINNCKHSLNIELIGRTFVFSSINYEYNISNKLALGTGLGLLYLGSGEISRNNNGIVENGNYFEMSLSQMLYANYFFLGNNKNKIFITAGISNFQTISRNKYPSETEISNTNSFNWNTGLGYQYNKEKIFFRLTGYVLRIKSFSDALGIDGLPWAGVTIGYKF